jgi:hypothetical protein
MINTRKPIRQFLFLREDPEKIINIIEQLKKKTNIDNQAQKFQNSKSENKVIDGIIDQSIDVVKRINNNETVIDKNVKRINNNNDYIKYKEYLECYSVILIEEDNKKYKIDFPNYNFNTYFHKNIFKKILKKIPKNTEDQKKCLDELFNIENDISQLIMKILNKDDILNKFKNIQEKNSTNIKNFINTELCLENILNNIPSKNIINIEKNLKFKNTKEILEILEIKNNKKIEEFLEDTKVSKNLKDDKKFLEDYKNILGIKYVLILDKTRSRSKYFHSFFSKNNIVKRSLIEHKGGYEESWVKFAQLMPVFVLFFFLVIAIPVGIVTGGVGMIPIMAIGLFVAFSLGRSDSLNNFKSRLTLGIPNKLKKLSMTMQSIKYSILNGVYFRIKLRNLIQRLKELHISNPTGIFGMNHRSKIARNSTKRVEAVFND